MANRAITTSVCLICLTGCLAASAATPQEIEADWLKQAEANAGRSAGTVATWADAAGAVDGLKDGKYAFHTKSEPNPWWQVDLGAPTAIARIVVYNRLDYAPGLHNADTLVILTSNDGKEWTKRHDCGGKHFGGVSGAPPLDVPFAGGQLAARYVRLQIPSQEPIYFHLDEVEVYGPTDAKKNLALRCPADQSSVSQWSTAKITAPNGRAAALPIARSLEQGRRLAADLHGRGVDTAVAEREFAEVAAELARLPADASSEIQQALYFRARWAMRHLVLRGPALDFDKLLVLKRFTQETYPDVCLNHMPWVSRPGGDICEITGFKSEGEATVRPILTGKLGPGHVHGMDLWWDGSRVVFGYAKAKSDQPPEGWLDRAASYELRRKEEPTHLFEIGVDGQGLRQLTQGEWSDLDPTYLANGDIAFVSERCGCSLQCNEWDKDETSCNLYAMRPDGSGIKRLTVTKDGDYLPHALDDGSIAYTRWEYQERGWANIQSIWVIHPDGTGADALFKQHFNDPWSLEDMRSIPDSKKLVSIATGHHTLAVGPVVVVDAHRGMNNPDGIRIVTPNVLPPEGGMTGKPVTEGGVVDAGGYYSTPWALSETTFLVSYTYGPQTDRTGYAIYLIDVFGTKELIYRDTAISCWMPMPLRARKTPPILPNVTDPNLDYAVCSLANVARGVPGIAPSQAKFLRIAEGLYWPYDNQDGGQRYEPDIKSVMINWNPVRVLGTVPIEADGSAHFRVPADTPVYFQLLDENQMELRRMRSFISFQPGEQRGCTGCHESREETPQERITTYSLASQRDPSVPVPPPWGTKAISFLRDVQPVLDRQCVNCHQGLKPAGGLDFSGGLTASHNRAYDTIRAANLVAWSNVGDDAKITQPLAFGSHRSKLVQVLREGECGRRTKVSEEDWLRLVTWIDANAPYHDAFLNKRTQPQPYDLPKDKQLADKITAVHAARCAGCHQAAEVSRLDWIDLKTPAASRFLAAPLSATAGGAGKCSTAVYKDATDADYQAVLSAVESAAKQALERPRRDLRSVKASLGR